MNGRISLAALAALAAIVPAAAKAPPQAQAAAAEPTLQQVVIVERHGVRSPTKPPAAYARYASDAWPQWPVEPGELTPHGADAIKIMGSALREHYAALGLLPAAGCPAPGTTFFWSDDVDQRTRQSGKAVQDGFAPGCNIGAGRVPGTAVADPLFHQPATPDTKDEPAIQQAFAANLAQIMAAHRAEYTQALGALHAILTPGANAADCGTPKADAKACALAGDNVASLKNGHAKLDGPLFDAASLTENLLLEYTQGFPLAQVGWGRAGSAAKVAAVMPLHVMAHQVRQSPVYARQKAGMLMQQIINTLQLGPPINFPGALSVPSTTRFTLLLGHDTNIANLAGLLGLDWTLPGQPDDTGPDTALAFELWKRPGANKHFVRIVVFYQTLDQLRSLTPLTGKTLPAVKVLYPDCNADPQAECKAHVFDRLARSAVYGSGVPPEAR